MYVSIVVNNLHRKKIRMCRVSKRIISSSVSNSIVCSVSNFYCSKLVIVLYITNQFHDQLPVGLLAQLVRALHRYRRGQGSSPGKPDFFRLSFHNCISCINNCEDRIYI